jgi:hypothetical protein
MFPAGSGTRGSAGCAWVFGRCASTDGAHLNFPADQLSLFHWVRDPAHPSAHVAPGRHLWPLYHSMHSAQRQGLGENASLGR